MKELKSAQYYLIPLFCLMLTLLLTACGRKVEDYEVGSASLEYYDISSAREELFTDTTFESGNEGTGNSRLLGMQYYQGEAVQLWQAYEGEGKRNVYLCRTDGSRELLLEGLETADWAARWYMGADGSFYCWKRSLGIQPKLEGAPYIRKLDAEGNELFCKELEQNVLLWDLCQLEDGRILLLLQDGLGGEMKLAEMDPANGALSEKPGVKLGESFSPKYIAGGSQGVLVLDTDNPEGIKEISMEDGSVFSAISFLGTSYSLENSSEETSMEVRGFRMREEGTAEILWADAASGKGIRETLTLSQMEKIPVILQTTYLLDEGWLASRAGEFNRSNGSYQVIIEYPDPADQVDFGTRMALQIAAGKGPDILYGYAFDFADDLAEKGGLVDLAIYMERDGIGEDEYYPFAFSSMRDGEKIYSFCMRGTPSFRCIRKELLGDHEVSDIESLLDALLDWDGEAFLTTHPDSGQVLQNFFDAKDCWGMIDWENGSCDFSGELFAKMLKTAKKYGVTWEKAVAGDYPVGRMMPFKDIACTFYGFKTSAELEKMGLVNLHTLLGKGRYSAGNRTFTMGINANSAQKEGAWEFVRYLMSEKVQSMFDGDMANKQAHKKWMDQKLASLKKTGVGGESKKITIILGNGETLVEDGSSVYKAEDITEERIAEYLAILENTGEAEGEDSDRIWPVYEIIKEEAEYYFADVKSLEEVVDIINNRVGLYIGEQHQ